MGRHSSDRVLFFQSYLRKSRIMKLSLFIIVSIFMTMVIGNPMPDLVPKKFCSLPYTDDSPCSWCPREGILMTSSNEKHADCLECEASPNKMLSIETATGTTKTLKC